MTVLSMGLNSTSIVWLSSDDTFVASTHDGSRPPQPRPDVLRSSPEPQLARAAAALRGSTDSLTPSQERDPIQARQERSHCRCSRDEHASRQSLARSLLQVRSRTISGPSEHQSCDRSLVGEKQSRVSLALRQEVWGAQVLKEVELPERNALGPEDRVSCGHMEEKVRQSETRQIVRSPEAIAPAIWKSKLDLAFGSGIVSIFADLLDELDCTRAAILQFCKAALVIRHHRRVDPRATPNFAASDAL